MNWQYPRTESYWSFFGVGGGFPDRAFVFCAPGIFRIFLRCNSILAIHSVQSTARNTKRCSELCDPGCEWDEDLCQPVL